MSSDLPPRDLALSTLVSTQATVRQLTSAQAVLGNVVAERGAFSELSVNGVPITGGGGGGSCPAGSVEVCATGTPEAGALPMVSTVGQWTLAPAPVKYDSEEDKVISTKPIIAPIVYVTNTVYAPTVEATNVSATHTVSAKHVTIPKANGTEVGTLTLESLGTEVFTLRAPTSLPDGVDLTLPASGGSANQALLSNGSGNMTWGDVLRPANLIAADPSTTPPSYDAYIEISLGSNGTFRIPAFKI